GDLRGTQSCPVKSIFASGSCAARRVVLRNAQAC
ncbi:hypothetical protein A2U01_0078773, partial [Trifolium medium]|nr:hypothetical protein [Trifolium medium]